jgi:hypothetical protein
LNVSSEISGLAKVGPIRGHADTVRNVIRSPQTAVHFVTLLEEVPVQETLDGIAELRTVSGGGIQPGGIFINMTRPPWPTAKVSDIETLVVGLKAAGLDDCQSLAADLAAELADEERTVRAQRAQRKLLDEAGQPCYELPLITDEIDLAALYRLAEALREQGAA